MANLNKINIMDREFKVMKMVLLIEADIKMIKEVG
jgi:hypothetical protein